jgi:murein L,D-transpeptidase YafK
LWFAICFVAVFFALCLGRNRHRKVAPAYHPPPLNADIDSIVVWKKVRKMSVFRHHRALKSYHISLGGHPIGPKRFQDDGRTPEGKYRVNGKNAVSKYHKNLGISYPEPRDVAYARKVHKLPGGDIKIHGLPNDWTKEQLSRIAADWTLGCIALKNEEIDELFAHCKVGIPVLILP